MKIKGVLNGIVLVSWEFEISKENQEFLRNNLINFTEMTWSKFFFF